MIILLMSNVTASSYADIKTNTIMVILKMKKVSRLDASKINNITSGSLTANKAIITDGNQHVDKLKTQKLYLGESGSEVEVTSSADKLNLLNLASPGVVNNNNAVIYNASGNINTNGLVSSGIITAASGSKIGDMTITNDTFNTSALDNTIKFGAHNLSTTGDLSADNLSLSGIISSTGSITAGTGSVFGDIKLENVKITSSASNNTVLN